MIDLYTKTILTVIAIMLTILVIHDTTEPANAQGAACGQSFVSPCYIELTEAIEVEGDIGIDGVVQIRGEIDTN